MQTKSKLNVTIEYDTQEKKYKAKPGRLEIKLANDGGVVFKAKGTDVIYFFPEKNIFNPPIQVVSVGKDKSEPLNLSGMTGEFPYAVFCKTTNDFAEGNSPPMMIIE